MKAFDEKTGHYYHIYAGEEVPVVEHDFTKGYVDEGKLYDNYPGGIPNWSKHYKGDKKSKSE